MKKLIPIVAAGFLFVGCDDADNEFEVNNGVDNREEAFEETGEAIKEGAEDAGQALENAAEETKEGFEKLGDEVDDGVDVDVDE